MTGVKLSETMAVAAAREIHDHDVVFVGIGLPNLAVNLAQRTHAPHVQMVYESGVFGARPSRLPISIGDPCLVPDAVQVLPMGDVFLYFLQGGLIDVGFLGAAQIDRFGNLNTTFIGTDYLNPKVRLPGSGGATEIGWLARKTIVIMPQGENKFVERLDFITTLGHHRGGDSRTRLGSPGGGPQRVITNLGVYGFDESTREMVLEKIHPGIDPKQVEATVSWPLLKKDPLEETQSPRDEELRLLREELDPRGIYLK